MGKKLISFLISTRFTAILFILFPLSMAIGTFIESYYNTTTAKILIYNAWWFEVMMVFFVINFTLNIKRYNLLSFKKWPVLLLHISWILIILGAGVTRYIGFEGVMPIRENSSSNTFLSEKTFVQQNDVLFRRFLRVRPDLNHTPFEPGNTLNAETFLSLERSQRIQVLSK